MSTNFCGIDFGTTNSSVALSDGQHVRVLPIDEFNVNPTSLPSLLYISKDGEQIVGRQAANTFIERNVDREVILKQVELGIHIQGYVGGEGDNDYGRIVNKDPTNVTEAVSAKAMIEVNSPGRLFQSLKTLLRMKQFKGTEVFGTQYQIEELTAIILRKIKAAADEAAGQDIDSAVFGRPVRFSTREGENETAERRLETAARLAGFKNISFFYEPVGACVEYAMTDERKQRLLVVDIGGGTFDVCIMEFGGQHGTAERLKNSKILSVSGVPIAGDAIDQEITREKMFPCFGSNARYGPSNLKFPQYLFNTIIDWQNIYKLNTEETINWLIAAESSSDQPETVRALRSLIQRNYGYPLARAVESAKIKLSSLPNAYIDFEKTDIDVHEFIHQDELAEIMRHMLEKMEESLAEAEKLAGIGPGDIDRILTTGGTSLIPAVRNMLKRRYGPDKLHSRDTFTSVASGLAIVAQHT
ncbi:MAG: Hsp70 family protein [Candidatus Hydrogenedentota bacterium]